MAARYAKEKQRHARRAARRKAKVTARHADAEAAPAGAKARCRAYARYAAGAKTTHARCYASAIRDYYAARLPMLTPALIQKRLDAASGCQRSCLDTRHRRQLHAAFDARRPKITPLRYAGATASAAKDCAAAQKTLAPATLFAARAPAAPADCQRERLRASQLPFHSRDTFSRLISFHDEGWITPPDCFHQHADYARVRH